MKLILVRHAQTTIDKNIVSTEWRLSEQGQAAALTLAQTGIFAVAAAIYSSLQPKAIETAAIIGATIGVDPKQEQGLAELSSVTTGFIPDYADTMHRLYAGEIDSINGGETLNEALERFSETIGQIAVRHSGQTVVIVSHANVLSLYSAAHSDHEAIDLHNTIAMPDVAVMDWNNGQPRFEQFWGQVA